MSAKTAGRTAGAVFLLAFPVYGGGTALVQSVTGTPVALAGVAGSTGRLTAGALLMLLNCALVLGIGVVVRPVLERHHPLAASAYLLTRGLLLSAPGGVFELALAVLLLVRGFPGARSPEAAPAPVPAGAGRAPARA